MSIYLGNLEPKKLFVGDKEVKSVFVGSHKVWSNQKNVVHIGEHDYNFVRIGDLLWLTSNLIESVGTYKAYDDGFLYQPMGSQTDFGSRFLDIKNILPDGWVIPEKSHWNDLYSNSGSCFSNLVSTDMGGTDDFGFNLKGSRYITNSGNYKEDLCIWWSMTYMPYSGSSLFDLYAKIESGNLMLNGNFLEDATPAGNGQKAMAYVRVCKSAE